MSAMGERFLILEETADALDVMDPELARQFRLVNGLPGLATNGRATDPHHGCQPRLRPGNTGSTWTTMRTESSSSAAAATGARRSDGTPSTTS